MSLQWDESPDEIFRGREIYPNLIRIEFVSAVLTTNPPRPERLGIQSPNHVICELFPETSGTRVCRVDKCILQIVQ